MQGRCMTKDNDNGIKPLYISYYNNDKYKEKRREQTRKDRFAWKVGIFIMTLISMVGTAAIWWVATS